MNKYGIDLTHERYSCFPLPGCPAIYAENDTHYLIVGKKVDPETVGLETKVAEDEVLLRVERGIIDDKAE